MKRFIFLMMLFFVVATLSAKPYFQQNVYYKIQVTLDAQHKTYSGKETLIYTNHSPDTLKFICLHLYPNAYKDDSTPFGRQMNKQLRWRFHFSSSSERGYLKLDSVKSAGQTLKYEFKKGAPDEIKIRLPQALPPGESRTLQMGFKGKFPIVFSRMGHFDKNYFAVTQWYPKAVVYDRFGWHPDSYLDQGEFYGEFGTFDVSITLPRAYVVEATGMLQDNPQEQAFNQALIDTTRYFLNLKYKKDRKAFIRKWKKEKMKELDYHKTKTVRFIAQNVHNFAWFAGLDYLLLRKYHNYHVLTNVLVTPENAYGWRNVPKFVQQTIWFYSKQVGPYLYPKASVVDGALKAGGGMEYPMVTIISFPNLEWSNMLEGAVMHEVGHNWFMGMLGSNERASTFLDEGMNSFLEYKYMEHFHGFYNMTDFKKIFHGYQVLDDIGEWQLIQTVYGADVSMRTTQPLNLRASVFTRRNYGAVNYQKGVAMLLALEWYLGKAVFWKGMHTYFERWNGRHPYIEDFFDVMSTVSGKNLGWFVNDWYNSTRYNDFTVSLVKTKHEGQGFISRVYVKNIGTMKDMPAPVALITAAGDTLVKRWSGNPQRPVSFYYNAPLKRVEVNLKRAIFETDYLNNGNGLPKIRIHFLPQFPRFDDYPLTFFPYYWYEPFKDKSQPGFIYWTGNPIIKQWFARGVVYYGTGSGKFGYSMDLSNRFHFPWANFSDLTAGIADKNGLKRFSFKAENYFQKPSEDRTHLTANISFDVADLFDMDYNDPHVFEPARYTVLGLTFQSSRLRMLERWKTRFVLEKGLPIAGFDQANFLRLALESRFEHRLGHWSFIRLHGFVGALWGKRVPQQELFYAAGFTDPRQKMFVPARRGNWALLHYYSYGKGMNMYGYSDFKNTFFSGRGGAALSMDLKIKYLPVLYVSAAGMGKMNNPRLFAESGLKLALGFMDLVLPLYISDPAPKAEHLGLRFLVHIQPGLKIRL